MSSEGLAESFYRPDAIVFLETQIESENRRIEFRKATNLPVTDEDLKKISTMKLNLSTLYTLWKTGEL